MNEREISLKDLVFGFLQRWRSVLAVMMIGGILMGGISYLRSYRSYQNSTAEQKALEQRMQEQQKEEEADDLNRLLLEEQLTETEITNVMAVITNEQTYSELKEYCQQSVYMQLDANAVNSMEISFLVKAEALEESFALEQAYETLMTSSTFLHRIAEAAGISENTVGELVTIKKISNESILGSNSFCVRVICPDVESQTAVIQEVVSFAQEQQVLLSEQVNAHELIILNQSAGITTDSDMLNAQKDMRTAMLDLQSIISKEKDAFAEEEAKYYQVLTGDKAEANADDTAEATEGKEEQKVEIVVVTKPSISVKYVVLGMFLFVFLYAFIFFIKAILNNKLMTTDDLEAIFSIAKLGEVQTDAKDRRLFAFIDKGILALSNPNKRQFSREEAISMAAVSVKMLAVKEGVQKVACIGCDLKNGSAEVCEAMKKQLAEDGIQLEIINNVLYNAEELEKLGQMKAAVLMEQAGGTLYQEILQEREVLKRQDIKLFGCIVVE